TLSCPGDAACAILSNLKTVAAAVQTAADSLFSAGDAVAFGIVAADPPSGQSIFVGLEGIKQIAEGLSGGIGTNSAAAVAACQKNSANCSVRSALGLLLAG